MRMKGVVVVFVMVVAAVLPAQGVAQTASFLPGPVAPAVAGGLRPTFGVVGVEQTLPPPRWPPLPKVDISEALSMAAAGVAADCAMKILKADPSIDPKMPRPAASRPVAAMRTLPAAPCPRP
jgi:hypothetical protein